MQKSFKGYYFEYQCEISLTQATLLQGTYTMAALQPSAKKHKTTMLQADDNTFNHLNTQDLFIGTDHPLLDPAAMEDSQMWMQDWHEDDLDHLIEPQQQQKQQQQQQQQDQEQEQGMDLQSQDMFSSNSSVGNKENLPKGSSNHRCHNTSIFRFFFTSVTST